MKNVPELREKIYIYIHYEIVIMRQILSKYILQGIG